jgi:cytochrome c peroxidase
VFNVTQFWDGRVPSLEAQAKLPILNPIELGQKAA